MSVVTPFAPRGKGKEKTHFFYSGFFFFFCSPTPIEHYRDVRVRLIPYIIIAIQYAGSYFFIHLLLFFHFFFFISSENLLVFFYYFFFFAPKISIAIKHILNATHSGVINLYVHCNMPRDVFRIPTRQ